MGSQEENAEVRGFDSYELRLGDELRGERATLGKSLLDVQRQLRIKAAYIAAVEDCDPDVFPNKGFIAGYVRSYARYLNLDPDEVFDRFCNEAKFSGVNASLSPRGDGKHSAARKSAVATAPDLAFGPLLNGTKTSRGPMADVSMSAVGSFLVLMLLIAGLGYGGAQVIKNIQRVEISPLDQRPGALSEVADIVAPGLDTEEVLHEDRPSELELTRLYQPRELEVPVVLSRDGPIVEIDPDTSANTSYGSVDDVRDGYIDAGFRDALLDDEPKVREVISPPIVSVIAQRPAWIRVYKSDGTIFFEKILDSGELYEVPVDAAIPLLRAGNAGSVFVLVNNDVFGPVGNGTAVAKNVSLLADDVRVNLTQVTEVPQVILSSVSALAAAED